MWHRDLKGRESQGDRSTSWNDNQAATARKEADGDDRLGSLLHLSAWERMQVILDEGADWVSVQLLDGKVDCGCCEVKDCET